MARLLGINRGESDSPREITRTNLTSESGESGWLIRFFDSAFFCEWIAVSYLYKHDHPGVRDYLCNRMYTLPLSGIESYLFQICYMMVHKPSPSLDKFVIDMCSKSLQMALKVHWFLLAELEDSDDNEGISRIQEKCQIAATLMGEWPPLIRPQAPSSPISKNQVLNKLLSSKQRLLSLTSSPPAQRSMSFAPSTTGSNSLQEEAGKQSPGQPDDNKIFKKFIPGPKVRDALLFRKSMEKDDEESEKDGFFKRLLRDSKEEEDSEGFFKRMFRDSKNDSEEKAGTRSVELDEKEGFFRRLLRDSKDDDEEIMSSSEGFFKRLFRDNKNDSEDKVGSKSAEEDEKDGFFRKIFKEKFDDKKDGNDKTNDEDKRNSKGEEEESSEFSLFRRLFRVHPEDSKAASAIESSNSDGVFGSSPGTENLFRKLFRDRDRSAEESEDSKAASAIENANSEGAFGSSPGTENFFRKLFRDKDRSVEESGDSKAASAIENGHAETAFESSPGTENFFRKLFRDRDRTVEDSELFGSKNQKEKRPGSPRQRNDKSHAKPPLPTDVLAQVRKGSYHASLDFVQSLCDTSYGLVDIFPIEDRKSALHESLVEINSLVAAAQNSGGVCFPMGRGMYRVVQIPEDEAVLLNSREKAPYLICVEVLKGEIPSHSKGTSIIQKLSRAGIPLANGDAQLHKPPPWAYPLWSSQDIHRNGTDRMLRSTSLAIDQAMAHLWEAKVNFVHVNLSVERQLLTQSTNSVLSNSQSTLQGSLRSTSVSIRNAADNPNSSYSSASLLTTQHDHEVEWVRVVLTADPGVNMGDIEVQGPSRRNQHRRVPSTIAIEEVKVNKGLKLTHLQFADDLLFFLEGDNVQAAAAKGEAPLGLPLIGAGQDSSDTRSKVTSGVPVPTDALSGELWEAKKERIRKSSVYGKSPDWDLRSVIVKSGDDCRQEHLAVQLVSHFYDIFQEAGLPLWLRPYEVLATSSYTALIETIPDTASIHSIKSRFPSITSLREFFVAKYQENSPSFKLAQRNFVESMAGYSILCYLLQVKDRHNGNLLLDEEGHVIHIDFGFMLSNSPGGVNFESAPFKLTRELLEVMDSDAEGVPSEFFDYFKVLCIQGFLTCRKHAERIILLVDMMQDSGYPCFKGGPRTIQNLRKRFHLSLTEEQCISVILSLIISSLDAWRTRQYDYYQRVLNGIL